MVPITDYMIRTFNFVQQAIEKSLFVKSKVKCQLNDVLCKVKATGGQGHHGEVTILLGCDALKWNMMTSRWVNARKT